MDNNVQVYRVVTADLRTVSGDHVEINITPKDLKRLTITEDQLQQEEILQLNQDNDVDIKTYVNRLEWVSGVIMVCFAISIIFIVCKSKWFRRIIQKWRMSKTQQQNKQDNSKS